MIMAILKKDKEEELFVSCEIGDDVREKIKEVRKMKGKRTGWLIKECIKRYVNGELVI